MSKNWLTKLVIYIRALTKCTLFLSEEVPMKENKVQQISHKLINIVVFVAIVEYAYLFLHFY